MPCDAVSIDTWFKHHRLNLEGHVYTKTYYHIVTQIGGLNISLNNLFIYKREYTLLKNRHAASRQKHEISIWVIL